MPVYETHVEFGKCTLEESDEDEPLLDDVESTTTLELSDIQTGTLYFDEHRKDSKHIPFILTPYTVDMEKLMETMFDVWGIPYPRIVLYAITKSDASPSVEYRSLCYKLIKGLVRALNTTEMWLCTDGLNYGFSRDIGRAFVSEISRRKPKESSLESSNSVFPETALIGICRKNALSFSKKLDLNEKDIKETEDVEIKRKINRRYGYFMFVDSETNKGLSKFLLHFMQYLNKYVTKDSFNKIQGKGNGTPVIALLLQGAVEQIDLVLGHLKSGMPLVVFESSGGLADLLAYVHHQLNFRPEGINIAEYSEAVLKPQVYSKINELCPDYPSYKISHITEKVFDCIRCSKLRDQDFITVLNINKMEFKPSFLPDCLLKALFKSRPSHIVKDAEQKKRDLFLAMDWNSPTTAKEEVFGKDTETFQIANEMFFQALTNPQREDFISLFLNQGFVIHTYLDSTNFLALFKNSIKKEFFRVVLWESVLGFGTNIDITRNFLDSKLIFLIEELTGIPSLVNSYELDWNSRAIYDDRSFQEAERKAIAILAIWAILSYRVQIVKKLWQHSEQPIHLALVCSIILKKLESFVTDMSLKNEMEKQSVEFSKMAVSVMTLCFDDVPCRALDLLHEKNRVWSFKALMELAAFAKNKMFLAHPCCQKYLDNLFMGHIKVRDLPYGDVTIPLWLKIIFSAFLIFPMYLWVSFEIPNEKKASDIKSLNESASLVQATYSKDKDQPEVPSNRRKEILTRIRLFFKEIYYVWSAPITKFWVNQVFYVLYLAFFSFAVIWPACGNIFFDFFACVWTATIILDSIYHAYTLNIKYTSMPLAYRCFEISLMILFLFGYAMGRIIWKHTFMTPYQAKVMLCLALLYFYYRLIFISLPISSDLGPMLYRVKRMIVVDFFTYIRVTILLIISNGIVIHAVVFPDYPLNLELARRAFYDALISFWLTPAENWGSPDPTCIRLQRNGTYFYGTTPDVCKVGRYYKPNCPNPGVWPYLFGLQYLIILRLILVVMLFALFSNTTKKLEEEGKYIWKYQRYALVINFENRLTLPPPLSIITLFYIMCKYLFYCSCDYANKYVLKYSKIKGIKRTYHPPAQEKLTENDFRYWKNLAAQHYKLILAEKAAEMTTKKRMHRMEALADALNKQRRSMRDLEGHLNELQLQITSAHQYLDATGMQASVRERLHVKDIPQIFSRISPYPNTMVSRFPVSDSHVPWKCIWTMYDPISFTLPIEDFPSALRPYVDVDIQRKREIEGDAFTMPNFNWNQITVSPGGVSVDRKSWITDKTKEEFSYELDSENLPKNPLGRTGLKGRGSLLRWGPNHYMYIIITRWHDLEELMFHKYLDVVLMSDNGKLGLPGGYVYSENRYEIVNDLFETGEKWKDSNDMTAFFESCKEIFKSGSSFWSRKKKPDPSDEESKDFVARRVKLGYMDEATNTDQAWCEVEAWHFHYENQSTIKEICKGDMDWYTMKAENLSKVPIGQAAIMHTIAKNLKAVLEII